MATRYEIATDPGDCSQKQIALVECYAATGNMTEAARVSGYKDSSSANRALKNKKVASYLKQCQALAGPHLWDASEIVNRIRDMAKDAKSEQAKIKALELLAKTKALLTDKVKIDLPRRIVIRSPEGAASCELGSDKDEHGDVK